MLKDAARDASVSLRQIEARQQSPDHTGFMECAGNLLFKILLFSKVV